MSPRLRSVLLLDAAAIAAAMAVPLVALGVPLLARHQLSPRAFGAVVLVAGAVGVALGGALLIRTVARPVERLLGAAQRLGGEGGLPVLGEGGGLGLSRAALAFERTAAALGEERARLAAKVAELTASSARLAAAQEGLLRAERLATVGRLAAGIAHEVGNPLGAIAGYAEVARARLAEGRADRAELDDFLARIVADTRRIDAIVRDLLDFARPADLVAGPVSLGAAVEAAARLARMQPRCREVALRLDLPEGLPAVLGDERRLAQVFLNLLLNAADAMGGVGEVRLGARADGAAVVVEVADDGPGIPAEALSRVFDPFFTTKEPGRGTGLGLAVCHGIMTSLGGSIEAGTAPGGGALMRLTLRVAG